MSVTFAGNPNEARRERARQESSKSRILEALRFTGPDGCSNADLNAISFRYGARILELRQAGHTIESIDHGAGRWTFVLHEPARITPGQPGYLASLVPVASITGRAIAPVTPDTVPAATCGLLFDL